MNADFEAAYDAWMALHRANGFAIEHFLEAPATEAQIADAEATVGFALPDDLKKLWRKANGQYAPIAIEDASPGKIITPFFGQYDFCPIARALDNYRVWQRIYDDAGPMFDANFNDEMSITRRGDDPVHREYWRPGWLPFSIDGGGNSYAVDLSPAPGGTYGQVILIGPDEDERRVLAPGIAAWLAQVAARRPALDHSEAEPPLVYFSMED